MNRGTIMSAAREMGQPSKKLIASYIFDWVIIIVFAGAGGLLSLVHPKHRPFSLLNQEISYPYVEESVPVWMLGVVAFLVPAGIITLITLIFVPGGEVRRISTRSQVLRLKLWELEKGLAGLCLSVAVGFFVTQGMKNLFGKPRPNLLARCEPNLEDLMSSYVGGLGQDISARWTLVDSSICTQTDVEKLQDGFRSFPSGHASWSWSGLLYLTLYFCSKFGIGLPHLPAVFTNQQQKGPLPSNDHELLPLHANRARGTSYETKREEGDDSDFTHSSNAHQNQSMSTTTTTSNLLSVRNAAAAPPNYLIIPALLPIAVAVYICSTRWAEFYHFGFDIIFGSLIGISTAWLAFRWYHLPISRGQGWAWGARSKDRSFAIGVGSSGYVGDEGWYGRRKGAGAEVDVANRA
ncbi:Putative phosphatidic acid phosphatase type 2/haloperoxidase [Septoria linicola]|uniref:Phosphatidic acid phosphatase type 2/haloperoxidase n=1 Tax=Septoria linicola TaxID=215465 RepID=A0A9Q9AJ03_9PEZI|nr:putative phosphatidic acid phosphatase type 2/haloperoxidase [Septoria linicola]USW46791.1 Putative phosphatidic acid phosphatase type 2/haloperoxidase [Septoria linicola]